MNADKPVKRKGFIQYAAVVLTAALLVLFVWLVSAPRTETEPFDPTGTSDGVYSPSVSVLDTMKMTSLIEEYYQAKTDADAETLNRIVVSANQYNAADLAAESNIIQKYDHFRTYVVSSETEGYYIVYVTYDIYFLGFDIGAPALNHFVLLRNGDDFVIYDKYISQTFENYLRETENSTVVQNLKKQVEDDLEAVCEANHDLKELMLFLEGNAVEPADPNETDSAQSESETESVPASTETEDEHN